MEIYNVTIQCVSLEYANECRDEIRKKTGYRGYIEKVLLIGENLRQT